MFERIQELCRKNGTNITSLCKEITGSSGNLPTWKNGNIRNDYLIKIADYFNVSTDYLLGVTSDPTPHAKEAPEVMKTAEALKIAMKDMLGRAPTLEEVLKLKEFVEIFVKGFEKKP